MKIRKVERAVSMKTNGSKILLVPLEQVELWHDEEDHCESEVHGNSGDHASEESGFDDEDDFPPIDLFFFRDEAEFDDDGLGHTAERWDMREESEEYFEEGYDEEYNSDEDSTKVRCGIIDRKTILSFCPVAVKL